MRVGSIIVLTVVLVWLGTWTYAADCNNSRRDEDNTDGTVTDCRTGMIWLKNAACTDTSNGIVNPSGTLNWYDALTWTKGLGNGLCRINGWLIGRSLAVAYKVRVDGNGRVCQRGSMLILL